MRLIIYLTILSTMMFPLYASDEFSNADEIVYVKQSQVAYAFDKILATDGAGPCMIFAGVINNSNSDLEGNLGFLMHVDSIYEIDFRYKSGKKHLQKFKKLLQDYNFDPNSKINYWIAGGCSCCWKKSRIKALKTWINKAHEKGLIQGEVNILNSSRLMLNVSNGNTSLAKIPRGVEKNFSGQQVVSSIAKIVPPYFGAQSLQVVYHPFDEEIEDRFFDNAPVAPTMVLFTIVGSVIASQIFVLLTNSIEDLDFEHLEMEDIYFYVEDMINGILEMAYEFGY